MSQSGTSGLAAGFDAHWLQLREPLDQAARAASLAAAFAAALPAAARGTAGVKLVDLAAGTGANFRALAPLIGVDQDWLLIDHDPRLLAAQHDAITAWAVQRGWHAEPIEGGLQVRASSACWRVCSQALDLARRLDDLDLQRFDGVVTTAFLDLVSAAWLERFAQSVAQARRPLLATLTVDGRRDWRPPLPADAELLAAFQRHQAMDKGFGPALGPWAAAHLADALSRAGLEVRTARSDWHIGLDHPDLLQRLVDEAVGVARPCAPQATVAAWQAERTGQCRRGTLHLQVGHVDLLAVPQPLPG